MTSLQSGCFLHWPSMYGQTGRFPNAAAPGGSPSSGAGLRRGARARTSSPAHGPQARSGRWRLLHHGFARSAASVSSHSRQFRVDVDDVIARPNPERRRRDLKQPFAKAIGRNSSSVISTSLSAPRIRGLAAARFLKAELDLATFHSAPQARIDRPIDKLRASQPLPLSAP
jgi:hypothetical protein